MESRRERDPGERGGGGRERKGKTEGKRAVDLIIELSVQCHL